MKGKLIYSAKVKMIELSVKLAKWDSHGMDTDCISCKLFRLKSLILSLERYVECCKKDFTKGKFLNLKGKKILLSENNNYFCTSEEQKINVCDLYLNCITEQEACKIAEEIKTIINC